KRPRRAMSGESMQAETDVEAKGKLRPASIAWQRFSVAWDYPVAFTRNLFDPANPLLADMLARREPEKRHRALVFVDDGLARARPDLLAWIEGYAATHESRLVLAAPVETVPGGEKIKTELTWIEGIQDRIHALGIDRHSYVIAIGGGA